MTLEPSVRNALIAGGLTLLIGMLAHSRRVHRFLPFVFLLGCGVLTYFGMLDRAWALESLRHDADWALGVQVIAWTAVSGLGLARISGWGGATVVGAVLGDRLAALALVVGEADPGRRARLVLAASGASLMTVTGSPMGIALGWGGWSSVALGLVLALVGLVGAPVAVVVREPTRPASAVLAGLVGLTAVAVGWFVMLGGTADYIAYGLEHAPYYLPRGWRVVTGAAAVMAGALVDESVMAMVCRAVFDRGLEIVSDVPMHVVRAGVAVGGGLPLLLITRSRLSTGLVLWLGQVAIFLCWAQWAVRV